MGLVVRRVAWSVRRAVDGLRVRVVVRVTVVRAFIFAVVGCWWFGGRVVLCSVVEVLLEALCRCGV